MTILLELDLTSALVEDIGTHPVEKLMNRRRLALRTIVGRLAAASDDPEVVGLLARLGSTSISLAQAQELSDAIMRFRRKGKEAIAWAETFGELGRGTTAYVVGTAFGELWLQPSGSVGLMGAAAAGTFVRDALDHAHVEPLFSQRHEYKNAVDSLVPPSSAKRTERPRHALLNPPTSRSSPRCLSAGNFPKSAYASS